MHLRIEKAAKEQVINQMAGERKEFISKMNEFSYQLGQANTKLQMLEAPQPVATGSHVQTDGETTAGDDNEPHSDPEPPKPEPVKRSFFGWSRG